MFLKGIKRIDILFILECLKWNEYTYSKKSIEECFSKENKKETLERMKDIRYRLKEAITK